MGRPKTGKNLICPACKKEFYVKKIDLSRHETHTCSKSCMGEMRRGKLRPETVGHNISLAKKGKLFSDEHKHNLSIAHKGIPQSPETVLKRAIKIKERAKTPSTKNKHRLAQAKRLQDPLYHQKLSDALKRRWNDPQQRLILLEKTRENVKCMNRSEKRKAMVGPNHPNWRGGISFGAYCPKFNREFKERVRSFFDRECLICSRTETENGKKLSVHHCDYDKEVCCNDRPPAFACLCTRHNSKVNYNRDRWEYIFHRIIDEMYSGKSYFTKEEYANLINRG